MQTLLEGLNMWKIIDEEEHSRPDAPDGSPEVEALRIRDMQVTFDKKR
jgi:hypothetical protein